MAADVLVCSKCGRRKDESAFPPSRGAGFVTRRRQCKACKKAQFDAWAAENPEHWKTRDPEKHRQNNQKHWRSKGRANRYGVTQEAIEDQEALQKGRCAICGDDVSLHVDHDADTGKVRGLLCGPCNRGIGMLKHDPDILMDAARYLGSGGVWQS